jgi:CheY-like chemotaxis protein
MSARMAPLAANQETTVPKILVIDDDHRIRHMLRRILEQGGHSVVLAENGIAGVARHRTELPDLVITDMDMPERGGAETIMMIRQEAPGARIIAVSGGGNLDGVHPLRVANQLGVAATLHKPFRLQELVACVSRILGDLVRQGDPVASAYRPGFGNTRSSQ